jgi:phosphatidylglycerol---prolipoprotein diacylglyceryl transferase
MSFDSLGIHIGIFYIRYYGLILMAAALIAAFTAETLARRRHLDTEIVWDVFLWVVIGAVVGARIWHILTPPQSMQEMNPPITTFWYLTHPFDAINLTKGGLGLPGALIGGALTMWLYVRRKKLSFGVWGDIAVPGIALGLAFGRLGNFVNHELYGLPSNLPWAIYIPPEARLPQYATVTRYHPLFLYESLLNIINFGILLWLGEKYRDHLKAGDLILVFFMDYGIIRFGLEFLRIDQSLVYGMDINQVLAAVVALAAAGGLFWRHGIGDWVKSRRPTKAVS